MRDRKSHKRTDIQALRAIAVLAVVIYHIWPERLVGGFMGVDIFFVISGYLMTLTLMRDMNPVLVAKNKITATRQYLVNFYARRIKRLIPAASVTLLATLGLSYLTGSYVTIIETAKQVFSSALFFQNWQLAANSVDYLASTDPPTAVQHFWSLSLEEQFYLVWPILLLGFFIVFLPVTILYKKSKIPAAILPTLLLTIGFFAYGYYLTKADPAAAYFVTFARVWELLIGCVVAFLPAARNHDLRLLFPWLGLMLNAYALYQWNGDNFPGWHALVPAIGTALMIYGGTGFTDSKLTFTNLFRFKPFQWIGDISYSLYLWHWPLIILLPMLVGISMESPKGSILKLGILVLSFILAWLSYKFVELPAQRINFRKRYIYLSFVVIVGAVAGSAYLMRHGIEARASSELSTLQQKVMSNSDDRCIGAKWQVNRKVCENGFGKIDSSYAQFTTIDHYRKIINGPTCDFFDYRAEKFNNPDYYCAVGNIKSNYQVTMYGDSHTSHWVNALDDIGKRNNIRFIMMDSHVCGSEEIQKPQCEDRIDFLKRSKILDESKYILISSLHRSETTYERPTGNIDLVVNTIEGITETPVYLLEDTPPAGKFIGPECVIYKSACKRKVDGAIENIKRVSANAIKANIIDQKHIITTTDMFCDDTHCYSVIGGVNVYYNRGWSDHRRIVNSHITASFSRSLALPLEAKLRARDLLPR